MPAFPPILGKHPSVLILGSMPGQVSLTEQQYYAHPRNAFWPIMSELLGFQLSLTYRDRVERLKQGGVAVWDVLYDCERPGSLDSSIQRSSEQANDFSALLANTPSLCTIAFNGQTSRKLFSRHCSAFYQQFPRLRWLDLPSTSPAYASITYQQKLSSWRMLMNSED